MWSVQSGKSWGFNKEKQPGSTQLLSSSLSMGEAFSI